MRDDPSLRGGRARSGLSLAMISGGAESMTATRMPPPPRLAAGVIRARVAEAYTGLAGCPTGSPRRSTWRSPAPAVHRPAKGKSSVTPAAVDDGSSTAGHAARAAGSTSTGSRGPRRPASTFSGQTIDVGRERADARHGISLVDPPRDAVIEARRESASTGSDRAPFRALGPKRPASPPSLPCVPKLRS